jgi:hypothetical protein
VAAQALAMSRAIVRHRSFWARFRPAEIAEVPDFPIGTGATREQFIATFATASKRVVFLSDVEAQP